jgi:hypothetical protein
VTVNKLAILGMSLMVLSTLAGCGGGGGDRTFVVSTSIGAGGSVSPGSATVSKGRTASFAITPGPGFQTSSVTGCGGFLSGNTFTTGAVTANCVVTASFSLKSYAVTAIAGSGGSISPASQAVNHGSSVVFTVSPATGYRIEQVSGCGGALAGATYTTGAITGACTVAANFSLMSYTVTGTAGAGGSISPDSQSVEHGSSATFTVTADTDHEIERVSGCSGALAGGTYATGAITGACTVAASFKLMSYIVTGIAGTGGTISPDSQSVEHGSSATFTVTADTDHEIDRVTGCDGTLEGDRYTTGAITAACTALATFVELEPLVLSIDAVHLNQGTQTWDGDIAAVAGRPGLLRVVVSASRPNTATPDVRLRLFRDGVQQWEQVLPARTGSVPTSPALSIESQTWNIELSPAEMQPGAAIEALVDPESSIRLVERERTRFPRGDGLAPLDVRILAPLQVKFIRIQATFHGGATANISPDTVSAFIDATRRWFPVGGVEADLRGMTFVTDLNLTSNSDVSRLLGDIATLRNAEPAGYTYYHGIMPGVNGIAVGGMAYVPPIPEILWARAAVSYDRLPDAAGVVAHELGHNMGRFHAPCGNPSGIDPNFPHANGGIGSPGYDIEDRVLRGPGGFADFMSYCRPRWTSDYTYHALLDWRLGDPLAFQTAGDSADPIASTPGTGVLIWGRVSEAGVELNPAFSVTARPALPAHGGAHTLRGFAADGALLFELDFAGVEASHVDDPSARHFSFFVPLAARQIAALQRVELVSPYGVAGHAARRGGESGLMAEPLGTGLVEERLANGELSLRWDIARSPVALVRDARSGQLVAIGRSGELRFPAGSLLGVEPEVLLSDGVRTESRLLLEAR